jgi:L-threonylcarbamoyladenylate synthase
MGKNCQVGVESTVISVVENGARLLRPGAVTLEMLREVFPDIVVDKAILSEPEKDEKVASPGMKYKHYAPKTTLYLVNGESEAFCDYVNRENAVAVCFKNEAEKINGKTYVYGEEENEEAMAQSIFAVLRTLDKENIEKAYVHAPKKQGVGLAVYNRLIRACAFRVIDL